MTSPKIHCDLQFIRQCFVPLGPLNRDALSIRTELSFVDSLLTLARVTTPGVILIATTVWTMPTLFMYCFLPRHSIELSPLIREFSL